MVNILGEKQYEGEAIYSGLQDILEMSGVHTHLYGKKTTKPFRKMGHVTVTAKTLNDAVDKAKKVKKLLKVISKNS
jgi:5-(carboxyamino)imidazole ribonucleotide synthase